ncbi:histidine kinase dimerization/phospho-acceptor domain-containing protein [Haloferax sp. ATB1]|uniref:histidine kinase dimerization/phospho-acceptor domain-containing protein n=1 Tax=Haloferax sp. ATB1 TaxID=1508454 RepID=UPI000693C44B
MVGLGAIEPSNILSTFSSNTVIANAVLGGGAGGIIVGIRSARDKRRQQSLSRQSDQIVLLNRLLRHEILNAITAIRGHAELLSNGDSTDRSFEAVRDGVDRIEETVDQVGFLIRTVGETAGTLTSVDLAAIIQESSKQLPDDATVSVEEPPSVQVRADEYLETLITEPIRMALERTSTNEVSVAVNPRENTVDVSVSATGQWLSEAAREVLLEGVPEQENQNLDYGIPIIRLLVAQYGGTIDIVEDGTSTAVVITLLRTSQQAPESDRPGVSVANLRNAALAGIVAGVVMGLILQLVAGEMGIIGALYGVQTVAVGWVTHLFHSIVFATVFVAAVAVDSLKQYAENLAGSITLGVLYGVFLWLVAAGVVMGVWLNLVGIPASIPNLGIVSLVGHTIWGALIGMLVAVLPTEIN